MNVRRSVRFKIVIGFLLVIGPLVLFLLYHNMYATGVVRDQISLNYSKLLTEYVKGTDNMLREFDYYLFRLERDPDLIVMKAFPPSSDDYVLAKQRLLNKYLTDIGYYSTVNSLFLYSRTNKDILLATQENNFYYERTDTLRRLVDQALPSSEAGLLRKKWLILQSGDQKLLTQFMEMGEGMVAGAFIRLDSLALPLRSWDVGEGGGVLITDLNGTPLTTQFFPPERFDHLQYKLEAPDTPYQMAQASDTEEHFLLVSQTSDYADIRYTLIVAENNMLRNLPYLQKTIYIIPLVVGFVLILFLAFLQRVLLTPMAQIIRGMRRIGQGRLDVRLAPGTSSSSEFDFMLSTFNEMARHIENLKISVYEEKLRVQKAEFKHLQVQINPHFYMNCLNIIYNLAALQDYKAVQHMSLHLADYFRFIMLSNRSTVTLADELKHIRNYLDIQLLRFPDMMSYDVQMPDHYAGFFIPPLLIQPFVENAVVHGFKSRRRPFRIEITAGPAPDLPAPFMLICVTDNGPGFPPELLAELNSQAYYDQSAEHHIGIWNVLHRLRMQFDEAAEVQFSNREGGGAEVRLLLPLPAVPLEADKAVSS
ncbi:sensor histidine kinase [Paenibacillus sp. y28]|uniref:sensor histidine kinase n=1 Tax=Paenibacillus sp. y28 TaxID=3129110 RepID=UPI003016A82F